MIIIYFYIKRAVIYYYYYHLYHCFIYIILPRVIIIIIIIIIITNNYLLLLLLILLLIYFSLSFSLKSFADLRSYILILAPDDQTNKFDPYPYIMNAAFLYTSKSVCIFRLSPRTSLIIISVVAYFIFMKRSISVHSKHVCSWCPPPRPWFYFINLFDSLYFYLFNFFFFFFFCLIPQWK
jgi:hypothetical protein